MSRRRMEKKVCVRKEVRGGTMAERMRSRGEESMLTAYLNTVMRE